MALLTLLLLVLEICVAVKSEVELQKRIYGGQNCNNNDRHYHVKLTATNRTHVSLCGGSLISDQWVLTAAHCWEDEPGWVNKAVVGVHPENSAANKKLIITDNPVIYTDQNNNEHDIMLLKLPEKITTITPVKLPDCNNTIKVGDKVQIAGFGASTLGSNGERIPAPPPAVLQCADFDIVKCSTLNLISQTVLSYEHVFCVESPGVDTCPGDSGGGAVYNNTIYGVLVAGGIDIICDVSSDVMDVCKFETWIKKTIKP